MGVAVWAAFHAARPLVPGGLVGKVLGVGAPALVGVSMYALLSVVFGLEEAHAAVRALIARVQQGRDPAKAV